MALHCSSPLPTLAVGHATPGERQVRNNSSHTRDRQISISEPRSVGSMNVPVTVVRFRVVGSGPRSESLITKEPSVGAVDRSPPEKSSTATLRPGPVITSKSESSIPVRRPETPDVNVWPAVNAECMARF